MCVLKKILTFAFLFSIVGSIYPQYVANPTSISQGNGTWGAILTISCEISGNNGTFTVVKTAGGTFSSSGTMYLDAVDSYGNPYDGIDEVSIVGGSTVSVILTDNFSLWSENQFPVEYKAYYDGSEGWAEVGPIIISLNQSPNYISSTVNPQQGESGSSFTFETTWQDPEGDGISAVELRYRIVGGNWTNVPGYEIVYVSGTNPPRFSVSKVISGTPGTYQFQTRAKDDNNNWSSYHFGPNFTIVANQSPNYISSTVNPQQGESGSSFTFETTWQDPEGDGISAVELRYRIVGGNWTNVPGYEIVYVSGTNPPRFSVSKVISGTPGTYQFQTRAKDDNNNWSSYHFGPNFTIVANQSPNYISSTVDPQQGESGSSFTFETTWQDPEGDEISAVELRYGVVGGSWTNIPGNELDYIEGTDPPSYTVTKIINGSPGTYQFQTRAKDDNNNWSAYHTGPNFTIIANQSPNYISSTVNPQQGESGGSFTFETTWQDPEGDEISAVELRYGVVGGSWTNIPGNELDYIEGTDPPSYTVTKIINGSPGTYQFQTRAKDDNNNWSAYHTGPNFTIIDSSCQYDDVPPGHSAYDAVTFLCSQGLLEDDDLCQPENNITRAALAKLAYLSIGLQNHSYADNFPTPFFDLQDASTWYYHYAINLTYLEFGDGVAPFTKEFFNFYPAKSISRKYALKVLLETWNIDETNNTGSTTFTDDEGYDYIIKAFDLGIIEDDGSHLFHPDDDVLRQDIFIWIYRMMDVLGLPVPNIATDDFFIPGNYTPYTFSSFDNMNSSNFQHYEKNGFSIPDIGIPLVFGFTYNSYATELSRDLYPILPIGYGWTHTYNSYIVETVKQYTGSPTDRTAEIVFPSGEINVYEHTGSNQYEPLTIDVYDHLEKTGGKYELTTLNQMVYTYEKLTDTSTDFPYVLTSIKDRFNNTLTVQYEMAELGSYKRIHKVIGTTGRELIFVYYANSDLLEKVIDPLGREMIFEYNTLSYPEQPDLISYVNPKGGTTYYSYGTTDLEKHLLKTITLPKGNVINNTYEQRKLKSSQTIGNNPITYTYDLVPNYTPDPANVTTTLTITNDQNANDVTTMVYNNNGDVISANKTNNFSSTVVYDPIHISKPKTVTVNGRTTQYEYFSNGLIKKVTKPLGETHQFTYTATYNDLETYKDPKQKMYYYNYTNGVLQSIETPRGISTFDVNTSNGLINSITNPEGIVQSFSYNSHGDVEGVDMPEGISTQATYDDVGRLYTSIDPNNVLKSYTFDNNDNLKEVALNATTNVTKFGFDNNDNLRTITNAKNKVTTLNYYFDDDLLKSVGFEGDSTQFDYYNDGKLKTRTTPNGDVFTYFYDTGDKVDHVNVSGETVSYDYWATTKELKSITNNNGSIQFFYDDLGRINKTTDYYNQSVEYEYDLNSNVKKIIYPGNKTVVYSYYDDNLLHTVTDWNGNYTVYTYRDDGLLIRTDNRDSNDNLLNYELRTYDDAGRQNGLSWHKADASVICSYTYGLYPNGNHSSETRTEPFAPIALAEENITYTNLDNNRLQSMNSSIAGLTNFVYDNNGNMTNKGGDTFVYDKRNRLISVSGSMSAQYEFDALNNRRKRTINGQSKRYVLDILRMSKVLLEMNNANNPENYYIYGLGLISRISASNQTEYYHYDYRGSTIAMTDVNGNITHKYLYDDYGKILQIEDNDNNPFRYVGKYGVMYESNDLYFMRARYYNPEIGRFLSEDPIWNINNFYYADNDPIDYVDPVGQNKNLIETEILAYKPYKNSYNRLAYFGTDKSYFKNEIESCILLNSNTGLFSCQSNKFNPNEPVKKLFNNIENFIYSSCEAELNRSANRYNETDNIGWAVWGGINSWCTEDNLPTVIAAISFGRIGSSLSITKYRWVNFTFFSYKLINNGKTIFEGLIE